MSRQKITINALDARSIEKAIADVQNRKEYTEKRLSELANALGKRGEEIAKQKCREHTNGLGDLEKSIWFEVKIVEGKFKVVIHMDAPYAAYVEFGTGIVGKGAKHPNPGIRDWVHDVNKHGEAGWVYKDEDGNFFWTQGQPAKPIMWETAQQLKEEYPGIVKEVFVH